MSSDGFDYMGVRIVPMPTGKMVKVTKVIGLGKYGPLAALRADGRVAYSRPGVFSRFYKGPDWYDADLTLALRRLGIITPEEFAAKVQQADERARRARMRDAVDEINTASTYLSEHTRFRMTDHQKEVLQQIRERASVRGTRGT